MPRYTLSIEISRYYTVRNFGLLFYSANGLDATKYSNTTAKEFIDAIKDKYGIPMKGFERMSATAIRLISSE